MRKDERGETGKGRTTRESLPPTDREGTRRKKKQPTTTLCGTRRQMIVQFLFFPLSFGYIENGEERDRKERMKTKHTGEKFSLPKNF